MRMFFLVFLILLPIVTQSQDRAFRRSVAAQEDYIKALRDEVKDRSGGAVARALTRDVMAQFKAAVAQAEADLKAGADFVIEPIYNVDLSPLEDVVRAQGDWGADYMGIERRWGDIKTRSTRRVLTVTFDTGRPGHTAIQPYIYDEDGQNWTNSKGVEDVQSHGTHCMGIKLGLDQDARPNPVAEKGLHKSGWQKVLSDGGSGSYSWVTQAVRHQNKSAAALIEDGWFVIYSLSLGGGTANYDPLESAFQEAVSMGVLILTSAGNTGGDMTYPSTSPFVEGVGALAKTSSGVSRASYSSFGEKLYGVTPGSAVYSTIPGNSYAYKSGTSMACPYMVQVFTILASIYPDATAAELVEHVRKYSTDLPPTGRDDETGVGWPVIDRLIDNKPGALPPPPPPPPTEPEICDDGMDNDGDGLTDCEDPDCDSFPGCSKDPEPIVKPARMFQAEFPRQKAAYSVIWYENGVDVRHKLDFRITVEAESKVSMASFADELEMAADKYFRSRGYILTKDPDFWDAAYWVGYFYDMMEGKKFSKLRVLKLEVKDERNRKATLTTRDLKDVKGLSRALNRTKGNVSSTNW